MSFDQYERDMDESIAYARDQEEAVRKLRGQDPRDSWELERRELDEHGAKPLGLEFWESQRLLNEFLRDDRTIRYQDALYIWRTLERAFLRLYGSPDS